MSGAQRPPYPARWYGADPEACPHCGERDLSLWADRPTRWHLSAQDGVLSVDLMASSDGEDTWKDALDPRIECSTCWSEWSPPADLPSI